MSFTKQFEEDVNWFTLDQSQLDGTDILQPSDDNPIQEWFKYEYFPYKDRVIRLEWTREIDFPYSVQSAMADITLRNTDGYFTPGGNSPIQEYILPKRPILLYQGFQSAENLLQFVGLTQEMPEVANTEAQFHALDFLSELYSQPLTQTIAMRDVYTNVVLESILQQLGLTPAQYNLAKARNRIPFLFFEKGITAGTALRQLMQAEGGLFWMDEQGIFRFTPRVEEANSPVFAFDKSNISSVNISSESQVINHVKILSNVREVQSFQSIHKRESIGDSTSDLWVVPAGGTYTRFLDLTDPAISAVEPTLGFASGVSYFTAKQSNGANVTSGVTADGTLFTNSYMVVFTNTNGFAVEIDELDVWGEPALLIDPEGLRYELEVDASIAKYGRQTLEIDNDFIGNAENANSLAIMLLDSYSEYKGVIEIECKPNPALQLNDVVEVDYKEYTGTYRIEKIVNSLDLSANYRQRLKLRRYTPRDWFILSSDTEARSLLNGTDQMAY